jgi:hypothetical protein
MRGGCVIIDNASVASTNTSREDEIGVVVQFEMGSPEICRIAEQWFDDRGTGLTIGFIRLNDGRSKMVILGPFKYGNRELFFDADGIKNGSGTYVGGHGSSGLIRETKPKIILDIPPGPSRILE